MYSFISKFHINDNKEVIRSLRKWYFKNFRSANLLTSLRNLKSMAVTILYESFHNFKHFRGIFSNFSLTTVPYPASHRLSFFFPYYPVWAYLVMNGKVCCNELTFLLPSWYYLPVLPCEFQSVFALLSRLSF